VSGWTVLVWTTTCLGGALLFLKVVTEALARVTWTLARREQGARKESERRASETPPTAEAVSMTDAA